MDEREAAAQTALIGRSLKRANNDLHALCLNAKVNPSGFLAVIQAFHTATTADPFGSRYIPPIASDDDRIKHIQNAEAALIRQIRTLEKI